jgi:hypothetical protein
LKGGARIGREVIAQLLDPDARWLEQQRVEFVNEPRVGVLAERVEPGCFKGRPRVDGRRTIPRGRA